MIYSTPPADFDGVTAGLRLIEEAIEVIDLLDGPGVNRGRALQAAAQFLHDAWLAVQTMAGRAQREEEEQKRLGGLEECLLCHHWKPLERLVRETAGYGGEDEERQNHYWRCADCHQQPPAPDRDPFEQDEA